MKTSKYKRLFDLRHLPMDYGRLCCIPFLLGFRHRMVDSEGRPYRGALKGGGIIVSNHVGFWDPIALLTAFLYRRVFFFASEEVMDNNSKLINLLLKGIGCIRIDRTTSDIEAVRTGCEIVEGRKLLCVFAQGHIQKSGDFETFKGGAVLIAVRTKAPIIPVYISQRSHWWQRKTVVVGDSFLCSEHCQKRFPSVKDIDTLTGDLLSQMKKLKSVCDQYQK